MNHIVLLEASDNIDLLRIERKLKDVGIRFLNFYEPDIHQCTAIATETIYGDDRKFFRKFKMYK